MKWWKQEPEPRRVPDWAWQEAEGILSERQRQWLRDQVVEIRDPKTGDLYVIRPRSVTGSHIILRRTEGP